jgi:hypothetical protein
MQCYSSLKVSTNVQRYIYNRCKMRSIICILISALPILTQNVPNYGVRVTYLVFNSHLAEFLSKPGLCPTITKPGLCKYKCYHDYSCPGKQKCCSNGCGSVCTSTELSMFNVRHRIYVFSSNEAWLLSTNVQCWSMYGGMQ